MSAAWSTSPLVSDFVTNLAKLPGRAVQLVWRTGRSPSTMRLTLVAAAQAGSLMALAATADGQRRATRFLGRCCVLFR